MLAIVGVLVILLALSLIYNEKYHPRQHVVVDMLWYAVLMAMFGVMIWMQRSHRDNLLVVIAVIGILAAAFRLIQAGLKLKATKKS